MAPPREHTMHEYHEISSDVGTRLLFENDHVRVWDLTLEPGEAIPLHRHELDYLYVVVGGGTLQTEFADGTADPPREMTDGEVRFRPVENEVVHGARNVGSTRWRNIVVELKRPQPS
jgi:beta-alanine degradation protein BauB